MPVFVAGLDAPDFDVDDAGLLPQPAADAVSAIATATPATIVREVRETLIASRSFQADSGDTVDSFPNRTVHRFVSPKVLLGPGA